MTLSTEQIEALSEDFKTRRAALEAQLVEAKNALAAGVLVTAHERRSLRARADEMDRMLSNIKAARALMNFLAEEERKQIRRELPPPVPPPPRIEPVRRTLVKVRVCGKHCFDSEAQAKRAARSRLCKGSNAHRFRVYFCPECKRWHMTSQEDVKR